MALAARTARRTGLLAVLALLGILFFTGTASAQASAEDWSAAEQSFVEQINAERAGNSLNSLDVDQQLVEVARSWTAKMAGADVMSHNPNLGSEVVGDWTRLGENVGYTIKTGAPTEELVDRLHVAFMNSPGHRANVLGEYTRVGVGVLVTETGKMWVTVNFSRNPTPVPAPVTAPEVAEPAAQPQAQAPAQPQIDEAVTVSRSVFTEPGSAAAVVLARSDVFADALGGAGLAGDDAPVLFTPGPTAGDPDPGLDSATRAEIDRVLGGNGVVYLLGGAGAVSTGVEAELAAAGYAVRRLAGASRVETSVAVAREIAARENTGEVLLARADDWADAVSGGAYSAYSGSPVLLTSGDELHPAVAAFLAEHQPAQRWALGGSAALSDAVVDAAQAHRVAGADRTATAVEIAQKLWGRTAGAAGDRYVATPGFAADGWAYSLAYAPWSAAFTGPQLLVGDTVPASVEAYLDSLGYGGDRSGEVVNATPVPGEVVEQFRALVE